MPRRHHTKSPTASMNSSTLAEVGSPTPTSTSAAASAPPPTRQLRHVAFYLDKKLDDADAAAEKPRGGRGAGRRGLQSSMTADEHRVWSARVAESEALRQRAMQCGDDIARVASGLGYEVVAHTPTAFLKRNSASAAPPAAVAKSEAVAPQCFAAAERAEACVVVSAAPLSPPCAAAPPRPVPAFLCEEALESCSSRSSSPGTEEQMGLVPVLSPLLHGEEAVALHPADDAELRSYVVTLPSAISAHANGARYAPGESSTHSLQEGELSWRDANSEAGSLPFVFVRENPPAPRPENTANSLLGTGVNVVDGGRSTPTTSQSSPRSSQSPRQSLTPRRLLHARNHGSPIPLFGGSHHRHTGRHRGGTSDGASSRGTSNANTSVSTEHLNGNGTSMGGPSQSTNRLLTPAANVLNTPAVIAVDDEIWPRTLGRPIQ